MITLVPAIVLILKNTCTLWKAMECTSDGAIDQTEFCPKLKE